MFVKIAQAGTSSEARHLFGRDAKSSAARTLRLHDAAGLCSVRMVRVAERVFIGASVGAARRSSLVT